MSIRIVQSRKGESFQHVGAGYPALSLNHSDEVAARGLSRERYSYRGRSLRVLMPYLFRPDVCDRHELTAFDSIFDWSFVIFAEAPHRLIGATKSPNEKAGDAGWGLSLIPRR